MIRIPSAPTLPSRRHGRMMNQYQNPSIAGIVTTCQKTTENPIRPAVSLGPLGTSSK